MQVPKLGDVVSSRYELTDELGRGGFGVVFQATQIGMNRPVALKVLLPQAATDDTMVERFVREAQLAKNLVHPNTIQLYDFGETDGGCLFIAMEYLEGETLDDLVKHEGQLPMDRVVHITAQILKSLAEAHEHGIIHRDLKPANIFMRELVGEKDFVKVLDFGIAKALNLDGAEEEEQLTKTGSSFGTPSYMAPEQIRGTEIGPHTDMYALGLIMVKMLTGRTAVEGGTPIETAALQLSSHPVPLPEPVLASPLGPVIQRALAKSLQERYTSAADFLADLQSVANNPRNSVLAAGQSQISGIVQMPTGAPTGPTGPSGQFQYSGQYDYNQLSGPVPMPHHPQQKRSAVVPLLVVIILLLMVGGAAGVYFLVLNKPEDSNAQAETGPDKTDEPPPETAPPAEPVEVDPELAALSADLEASMDKAAEEAAAENTEEAEEPPPPVMVEVALTSDPSGAIVKHGDLLLGTTPMSVSLEQDTGVQTLEVSAPDYKPATFEVDTAEGVAIEPIALKLDKERRSSRRDRKDDRGEDKKDDRKRDDRKRDDRKKDDSKKKDDSNKDETTKKTVIPMPD